MSEYQKSNNTKDFVINSYITLTLPIDYAPVQLSDRDKWIEELRSGKYERAEGRLCIVKDEKPCYCCLGVLSLLQGRLQKHAIHEFYEDGFLDSARYLSLSVDNPNFSILGSYGNLPKNVFIYDSLTSQRYFSLSSLNDSGNCSFNDIATVIEIVFCA